MFSAYRRPMHINRYSLPNTVCDISYARLFTPEVLDEVIWTMVFFVLQDTMNIEDEIWHRFLLIDLHASIVDQIPALKADRQ